MGNQERLRDTLPKLYAKYIYNRCITPPIAEIIWVQNVRAIVVCGFLMKYLKKTYPENLKKIVGAVGLDWLCYLAGNSQTAPRIFFKFSG